MSLFVALLASIGTWVAIVVFSSRGEAARAGGILRFWGIGAIAYAVFLFAVAAVPRSSGFEAAAPHCDDDWCMTVDSVSHTPAAPGELAYRLSAIPFDVDSPPGESVATSLTFDVAAGARELYFTGGMPGISYASFVIGNGDLLNKPRMRFRIQ